MTEIQLKDLRIEEEITVGELKVGIEFPKTGIITKPLTVTENGVYKGGTEDGQKVVFNPVTVDVVSVVRKLLKDKTRGDYFFEGSKTITNEEFQRIFVDPDITKNIKDGNTMFGNCALLEDLPTLNTSNMTNLQTFISGCPKLKRVAPLDTSKATNLAYFSSGSYAIEEYQGLDMRSCTRIFGFEYKNLKKAVIKNIKTGLQIGNSYTNGLSTENLISLISELLTAETAQNFTIGSVYLGKLANVYVRLIEITDEMREKDDLIDEKLPFEVCESTDDGAMLITSYVNFKNWELR